MILEEDDVAGIKHTNQPSAIESVMNDLYEKYDADKIEIPQNSLPLLSHTYRTGVELKSQIKSIEEDYQYVVLPSYLLMWNINPEDYDLEFGVYFHDLYRAFVNKSLLGLIVSYKSAMNSRKASHLITNSKITEQTVEQTLLYDTDKDMQIVKPPIKDSFYPENEEPVSVSLPENYVLYIGSHSERKNTLFLLDILEEIPRKYNLVVGGNRLFEEREEQFKKSAKSRGISHRVCHLGYLSDKDLRRTYTNAEAYILPSKYGGYELTPLEAEECGTPAVMHTKIPSSADLHLGKTFKDFNPKSVAKIIEEHLG